MGSDYFPESVAEDFADRSLAGQTVALAGGSGGLGAAAACLLASEGARLVIGSRSGSERSKALQAAAHARGAQEALTVASDLTTEIGRTAFLDAAKGLYGLVVFVGDPARGSGEDVLRRSIEINYLAPILLARQAAERMQEAGVAGSIVLFASMQSSYPFEGSTAYGAAKAALVHAAKVLAKEAGGKANIRVNVVAPGATMAGMAQASLRSGKYDPFVADGVVPRFGRAEDVARAVRFFLEPDSYVTGQVLTVDGGMTLRRDMA